MKRTVRAEIMSFAGGFWWKVENRVMLVRYTHRSGGVVRIIGAGCWEKGAILYEQENQNL
jgi:hypothetical protein